jgi:putative transposase
VGHVNGDYTTNFIVKHQRSSHLIQGRYKAMVVEADSYTSELSRYIHLNPVHAQFTAKPENYSWSSYRSYNGIEPAPPWLTPYRIIKFFKDDRSSRQAVLHVFVENLLAGEHVSPLQASIALTVLGSPKFVKKISRTHLP